MSGTIRGLSYAGQGSIGIATLPSLTYSTEVYDHTVSHC